MQNYLTFVLENRRFLAYGLLFTMVSSFGHTYFIGLFGAEIRAEFGLSHGSFGSIYSLATLGSGVAVIWLGRKIDDVDLRLYTALVCAALVAACFFLALAPGVAFLTLALFSLRLAGPGLTVHAATTSMARYFGGQRGKASAIASLGQTAGEADPYATSTPEDNHADAMDAQRYTLMGLSQNFAGKMREVQYPVFTQQETLPDEVVIGLDNRDPLFTKRRSRPTMSRPNFSRRRGPVMTRR
ncbi:MAG: MFS transporter [Proteobacteria bacterium]|nr:MFS transporter [Pseudomonadota bacterium]